MASLILQIAGLAGLLITLAVIDPLLALAVVFAITLIVGLYLEHRR